jgi:hypothetical protein
LYALVRCAKPIPSPLAAAPSTLLVLTTLLYMTPRCGMPDAIVTAPLYDLHATYRRRRGFLILFGGFSAATRFVCERLARLRYSTLNAIIGAQHLGAADSRADANARTFADLFPDSAFPLPRTLVLGGIRGV